MSGKTKIERFALFIIISSYSHISNGVKLTNVSRLAASWIKQKEPFNMRPNLQIFDKTFPRRIFFNQIPLPFNWKRYKKTFFRLNLSRQITEKNCFFWFALVATLESSISFLPIPRGHQFSGSCTTNVYPGTAAYLRNLAIWNWVLESLLATSSIPWYLWTVPRTTSIMEFYYLSLEQDVRIFNF